MKSYKFIPKIIIIIACGGLLFDVIATTRFSTQNVAVFKSEEEALRVARAYFTNNWFKVSITMLRDPDDQNKVSYTVEALRHEGTRID